MPDFDRYLEKGQMEIVPHTEWYLKDGVFNLQRVLNAWLDKLKQALAKGYDGMRVTGDTVWLMEKDWRNFTEYEEEVDNYIGKLSMLAICTYPLDKYGASEVIDVIGSHQFILIRQAGAWVLSTPRESRGKVSQITLGGSLAALQRKFTKSGFKGLEDEEIIELFLGLVLPYWEATPVTKRCIEQFQNLRGLLSASPQQLQQAGLSLHCIYGIKLLHELPIEVLKEKIIEQPVHSSSKEIFDYLNYSMRDLKREVFKVIYLNNQNQIINVTDLFEGTLDSIPIHPREIVESAIKHSATHLIFVHNHPAGDPSPSKSDKRLTRDLAFMGMILEIKVLDHIIIGENRYFSFADEGLIKKYEDDFLNLRIKGVFDSQAGYSADLSRVYQLHRN